MHIRPRRDDDLEHLVEVLRRTHREDGYPARWPDDPASWLTPPGHLAAWTAWSSGSVVGHVGLAAPDPDAAPLVTRLVVHRDHRGLGIADALLATAEAAAGAAAATAAAAAAAAAKATAEPAADAAADAPDVPTLRLDVTEETPGAWRLYERRGWRLTHRSPADWAKPDGTVPTMRWYEKRLR
ncbi:GNAT family N-acetyltransferase [Curtobacterium sp. Csp1]|uniref:GNAT family N-acetyltransferase n=1 Tax=unclassified Curtobacterium TaxID=257496 RepID=UPI001597E737|nr:MULTISPECIES: GNAT family N-acetyltransferase [unclassified Curtobacterium]QKS12229.1 GNAT family N-acetyltransferase [Curtobacterium sp. csp3]QKS19812.1 GNAT family N-acetyltransferase [Curtobacterium sp. Csp1]